jgi:enoyl-CoA hydratase/carnithine racemase
MGGHVGRGVESQNIGSEARDGVLSLTLKRAEKKNAITGEMYEALLAAFIVRSAIAIVSSSVASAVIN